MKKKEAITIDLENTFRSKIESILITASWLEDVREIAKITGVSQVWGDHPAWYFWISDAPGVYALELEGTCCMQYKGKELFQAALRLKCYPFVNTDVFGTFSFEERSFLQSPFFDSTHTPCFDDRQKIPANLFTVAALQYTVDAEDTVAAFTLETVDTLRTTFDDKTSRTCPLIDKIKTFEKGFVDREVPGTRIGYVFFDRLLCLFSAFCKQPPQQVISARSGGFEHVCDNAGHIDCVDSVDNFSVQLSVLYALSDTPDARKRIRGLAEYFRNGNQDVSYDRSFSGGHLHSQEKKSEMSIPLNSQWWTLARGEHRSNLVSSCGCS